MSAPRIVLIVAIWGVFKMKIEHFVVLNEGSRQNFVLLYRVFFNCFHTFFIENSTIFNRFSRPGAFYKLEHSPDQVFFTDLTVLKCEGREYEPYF